MSRSAIERFFVFVLACVLGVAGCDRSNDHASTTRVNDSQSRGTRIVLITLDTLRRDTLDGTPDRPSSMPLTKEWARKGIALNRHYAATSTTEPTHASLLTGLAPWQHGVSRNGLVLDASHTTLAEVFAQNDYRTGAVVSSFPLHRAFGFEQGFEVFDDAFEIAVTMEWSGKAVPNGAFYSLGETITAKALRMIDDLGGPRQFFWFHYFDLHEPYGDASGNTGVVTLGKVYDHIERLSPTTPALIDSAKAAYENDARALDRQLDRLFRRLQRDAAEVDTHILVVSDHGESFGEGGSVGHGKHLGDELIHVPCFLISPVVEPGSVDAPVGSIDIPITLLSLAGLSGLPGSGQDVTKALSNERSVFGMRRTFEKPFRELRLDGKRHLIADFEFFVANQQGVTTGNARNVEGPQSQKADGENNARELFGVFERELSGVARGTELDERSRAALEALGYVQ